MSHLVSGLIANWSGAIVDIPVGWGLCDGSAGTPDLRDRFVVGAGTTYNPGDNGGSVNHTHPFTTDGHDHHLVAGTNIAAGSSRSEDTNISTDNGTTNSVDGRPPYYALAFIMFL